MPQSQDLLRAERLLRHALMDSAHATLAELLADQLLWVDPLGTVPKAGLLDGTRRFDVLDIEPSMLAMGPELALTSVSANVLMRSPSEQLEGLYLYLRTWVREGAQWRVQSSMCLPAGLLP